MEASYTFDFSSDYYPQDLILYFTSTYQEKQPFISAEWLTPDGRKIRIVNMGLSQRMTYRFSQDAKLKTRLRTDDVIPALFTDPETGDLVRGQYQLLLTGAAFEPDSDIDAEFVFHGQVFGLAGTDPGFPRWYPDQGMTADQYEQSYETWKKRMTESFVSP